MSQYLLSFAKDNLVGKPDAYIALLWCMYKANQDKGRYSEHIKSYLTSCSDKLLDIDYQRLATRFKRVLDARPELDWIEPSGLSKLAVLQVKNFRGFGELSSDDKGTYLSFSKMKNIFYAPNGGGKSSLCEALEYATTGNIKESERRKTKVKQYITRGAGKCVINLLNKDKNPVARSLTWSGCFIDRNRLQEFSLLGSKDTGSVESDVIATLFGLEEFQDVISRFVKPDNFNLGSFLLPDYSETIINIEQEQAVLIQERTNNAKSLADLNSQVCNHLGLQINQQYAVRSRFKRLAKLAELKIRKAERLKLAEAPIVVPLQRICRAAGIARRLLQKKDKIEVELLQKATAVNYQVIYEALHSIESIEAGDICPACSTPLHLTVENPFEKARRELQMMGALKQLKIANHSNQKRIVQMAVGITTCFANIDKNIRIGMPCNIPLTDLKSVVDEFNTATNRDLIALQLLQELINLISENLPALGLYIKSCKIKSDEFSRINVEITHLEEQALALQQKQEMLRGLFTNKKALQQEFIDAGQKITEITARRLAIKVSTANSTRFNSFINQLQSEYGNLYRDVLKYKLDLEKSRIAGIESKATEYYKKINQHDYEHECIDSLCFKKISENYRIKLSRSGGGFLDAFAVLSEGHLRVLGLSLLLAMAEKNNLPLIVFDDVVNAIDSDHRSNIIDLFFSDHYLRHTQMIVTTHDRLFWERFCIIAERHTQSDQHSSCVLSYTNKGIVVVDHAGGFQEKVHRALSVYDIRQALIYCRIWFESMVVEYCLDNSVSITAHFNKSQLKRNAFLQISLEKTFSLVEPRIAYDLTNFNLIKNDLINWGGQNQEHHAFDEGSLNFVHSKTSEEVIKVYNAIRLLECQLFPRQKKASSINLLNDINVKITRLSGKIDKLDKAPVEVQKAHNNSLTALKERADEVTQELAYIETCLLGNA